MEVGIRRAIKYIVAFIWTIIWMLAAIVAFFNCVDWALFVILLLWGLPFYTFDL